MQVTMPFGKHRGEPVDQVPVDYLQWCLENMDIRSDRLREAIRQQVEGGEGQSWQQEDPGELEALRAQVRILERENADLRAGRGPAAPAGRLDDALRAWRRQMSQRWHPDHGGTHEAQQAVNEGADLMAQLLGLKK